MNTLVNSVRLMGNLGKEPVIREFSNGGKIANFSLATRYVSKDKEGNKTEETSWHNVVVKGRQADIVAKYLTKGSPVAVEGRLNYRKYNDADGNERYVTEIVVSELQLIGGKKGE